MEIDNPVPEWLNDYYYPLVGNRMIELGQKQTKGTSYKKYFESLGLEHISIDISGLHGALKLDLRESIDLEPADMVTNIGTTEHVTNNQKAAWENIHNFCKVGGVFISCTPIKGDWWWHGDWYPTESFYSAFAENGYEIERMETLNEYPKRVLTVRMKKISHEPFVMPDKNTLFHNIKRPRHQQQ